MDLDRTLLRGASGLVLSAAMQAEGLFDGRPSLPGERILYRLYNLMGESLAFMAMVRAAPRFTRGWDVEAVCRAGERAAPELAELVQPYAPAVLAGHREAGRLVVLATTSPVDLVAPFAGLVGFDDVVGTRYGRATAATPGGSTATSSGPRASWPPSGAGRGTTKVDLARSHAYSDSVFDLPLLGRRRPSPRREPRPPAAGRGPAAALARRALGPAAGGAQGGRARALPPAAAARAPGHVPLRPLRHRRRGPRPRRGPVMLAANHRSYFDVVALAIVAARLGRPVRFLAKRELFDAPVVGPDGPGPGRDPRGPGEPIRHAAARRPAGARGG